MKSHGLFSRAIVAIIPAFCLLFLIGAPLAHAQEFSFPDFSSTSGLQLNGNAAVFPSAGTAGAVLRLTPALGTQNGSAFYTTQLPLKTGFSSTFTFQFTNGGGSGGHADGIAFLIQNAGIKAQGFSGGAIGYGDDDSNQNHSLGVPNSVAIEFDTYANGWDVNNNHIAVMSCGAANNNQHHGLHGCASGADPTIGVNTHLATNLTDGAKHTVIVTYQPPCGSTCQNLTIQLDGTQVLAVIFDLASLGLDANDDAYVGFTGSTGGGFENQDIDSWSFGVTVVQTFNTDKPTNADFSQGNVVNTQTLDLSKTVITCKDADGTPITCPTTTLSTTNTTVPAGSTWPQYVGGTPFATSVCAARPANGGAGDLCSLFVNACFGGTVSQGQASDFFCPFATPGVQNNNVVIKDTWDPLDPKPDIAPGTTVSLIDFVPSTPDETWSPTSVVGATNPVCTNVFGPGTFQCDISDSLTDMFGDQTTTRGTKPKKGWIVSVFNVPMLTTTWSVIPGGPGCPPTPATALNTPPLNSQPSTAWFNGACLLQFTVNAANPSNPTNGFVAAPPASITYGANNAHVPVVPGDQSQTNGDLSSPWTFSPGTLQAVINLLNGGNLGDGTYVLHWSAVDNVGISEKNIQLIPALSNTLCYNPEKERGLVPPCYNTDLFTTNLNMDSTAPAASCTPTPDSNWHNTELVFSCTASDATSGIGSATPSVSGVPAGPGTQVAFTVQTSVGAGNANSNASTNTQQLWDLAKNETDESFSGLKVDRAFPTISSIVLSPSGTYTVGQKVTATFTCNDVGSGLVAPCLGTGGVASGGFIDTSSPGFKTFTVTATDVAGNITNNSVNYTVNNAPSADVALFEQPGSPKRGSNFNAIFWALDLSNNTASNVNITATLTFPAGVLGGSVTAKAGIVSCTLLGCTDLTAGTSCTVSSNTTVSCTFTSLPSVFKLNGAAVKITIPISATATVGSKFTVSGIVNSANDPNSKNNTASQTFTVGK